MVKFKQLAISLECSSIIITISLLLGFIFNIQPLEDFSLAKETLSLGAILCFLVLGSSLLVLHKSYLGWIKYLIRLGSLLVFFVAAINIIGYIYLAKIGISQLLMNKDIFVISLIDLKERAPNINLLPVTLGLNIPKATGITIAEALGIRLTVATAINFILISMASFLATYKKPNLIKASQCIAVLSLVIPALILFNYIYQFQPYSNIHFYFQVAILESCLFILLALGLLLSFPDKGIMIYQTRKHYYSVVIFRFSMISSFMMILFGYFRLLGEKLQLFEASFGTALIVTLSIFCLILFTFYAQYLFHKAETTRLQAVVALSESEKKVRTILDNALEAFISTDKYGAIIDWNKEAEIMFGWKKTQIIGKNLSNLIIPANFRKDYLSQIRSYLRTEKTSPADKHLELHAQRKNGEIFPIVTSLSSVKFKNDILYSIFISDISARKQIEQKLQNYAYYDALTGVANRIQFNQLLHQEIMRAQRMKWQLALFFLDLDNFKMINDTFGHHVGDHVLKTTAERLQKSVRKSDIVSRYGGDEFVLTLVKTSSREEIEKIAQKINTIIKQPVVIANKDFITSVSIGISLYPENAQDEQTLIDQADLALYKIKHQGGDGYGFF